MNILLELFYSLRDIACCYKNKCQKRSYEYYAWLSRFKNEYKDLKST